MKVLCYFIPFGLRQTPIDASKAVCRRRRARSTLKV
jgi:hypothetical protein